MTHSEGEPLHAGELLSSTKFPTSAVTNGLSGMRQSKCALAANEFRGLVVETVGPSRAGCSSKSRPVHDDRSVSAGLVKRGRQNLAARPRHQQMIAVPHTVGPCC